MMYQELKELLAWLKDSPHRERCSSEFGDNLCSCGKRAWMDRIEELMAAYSEEDGDED